MCSIACWAHRQGTAFGEPLGKALVQAGDHSGSYRWLLGILTEKKPTPPFLKTSPTRLIEKPQYLL